jgi:TPR repeat protein
MAADQGNHLAQYNLGDIYANGRGVARDDAEAVEWVRLAAEQEYDEALEWLRKAAKNGNANARDALKNLDAEIII